MSKSLSVLLVEDYEDLRSTIAETLKRHEYDCDSVTTSEDAILKLRDNEYGAILISPRLPIADDPMIHYLVENSPGEMAKVIVMSDPTTPSGEWSLLQKPFTNDQLFAVIERQR